MPDIYSAGMVASVDTMTSDFSGIDSYRVKAAFPVQEIVTRDREVPAVMVSIGHSGVRLLAQDIPPEGVRFVWLDFKLPGERDTHIRALAEVVARKGHTQELRFKHLFPDYRERLDRFVDERTNLHEAA